MEKTVNKLLCGTFLQYQFLTGEDFQKYWDEVNDLLAVKNEIINFCIPISILTIYNIQTFINLIHGLRNLYSINEQKVQFYFDLSNTPGYLDIRMLDKNIIEPLEYTWAFMVKKLQLEENDYKNFTSQEITTLEKLIEYVKNSTFEKNIQNFDEFVEFVRVKEKLLNCNFFAVFPELIEFYNQSQNI